MPEIPSDIEILKSLIMPSMTVRIEMPEGAAVPARATAPPVAIQPTQRTEAPEPSQPKPATQLAMQSPKN